MCWYTDAKTCCESFMPASRRASANYCIGKDGEIWCNVEEENRAWTSGSSSNDNRAITIECANYMDGNNYGKLPVPTWNSLVNLCVDICVRYGFTLKYTGSTSGNLTMHKWFQDTDCPGPWLSNQFNSLAIEVNNKLKGIETKPYAPNNNFGGKYICNVNGLRIRAAPNTSAEVVGMYLVGDTVILDDWYTISDGYVWGRYIGFSSGKYRYLAIGRNTGKIEKDDYLIKVD